ncbi:sugar phosphate isomerase/epimerase family protein [Parabacteroides bouchesdurhonensis]|uniref:sugar phosphate isomerase/epimerase family protein n=1 Tax=Parabacteroides bouchesdurhonensis TaxID=1936995 RepID=UPI000E496675|nr:sugar phosphate isomerase/epimerase [Parabacteroides bouchesdurhonensis]RHJ91105.1 sugar phosphate isomerase/epimerase [Bacteroides sp. AM07-16]
MSNRRDFLRKASFFSAAGLLAGKVGSVYADTTSAPAPVAAAKKKIGLQIYSLGKELYEDLPKRLKEVKSMGYTDLELAGYDKGKIGGVDMMEFKKMAEDAGLKIISSHVNPPVRHYTKENKSQILEYWKPTAEDHVKLGCKYLIQPMMPECGSYEDAAFICDIFNEGGEIVKATGLPFGYHNHNMEFQRVVKASEQKTPKNPGDQIYDLFLAKTDPSLVFFEMDVYWTVMGQNDPVEYMQKHPDRIKVLHIKDRAVFGQSGMMNFEMIFKQMYANGIQDYFVELEHMPDGRTQFAGVKDCAAYLQKASFVK